MTRKKTTKKEVYDGNIQIEVQIRTAIIEDVNGEKTRKANPQHKILLLSEEEYRQFERKLKIK